MEYIYGKLNVEKVLKEYTPSNLDGTLDLSIDNTKNEISAKVNKTPGVLTILKVDDTTGKQQEFTFDGSENMTISLKEINNKYIGLEQPNGTANVLVDPITNAISVDVLKTPGTLSFQKANVPLDRSFDGSKDVVIDIPETIFTGKSKDNTIEFETENITNTIWAQVKRVPHKLHITVGDSTIEYDGSNDTVVSIPTPNLTDFVTKSEYATADKPGLVRIDFNDGVLNIYTTD